MKLKKLLLWSLCAMMMGSQSGYAQSSMTDKQVLDYVLNALKAGKDQNTIAIELARRGVTEEQAIRVKNLYQEQTNNGSNVAATANPLQSPSRQRTLTSATGESSYVGRDFDLQNPNPANRTRQAQSATTRRVTAPGARQQQGYNPDFGNRLLTESEIRAQQSASLADNLFGEDEMLSASEEETPIFGRNIFNSPYLTFEPSLNLATPRNYVLGAGDEVIIDIWGDSETTIRQEISPDGNITIEALGPVQLAGKTIESANTYLRGQLSKIYSGLNDRDGSTEMLLSLGQARTIQVNVMGEAFQPGSYNLSSFATAFHAIYSAGGVSDIGSLRNISIVRQGKTIATIDLYALIMKGRIDTDLSLQEGDFIIIPAYTQLVDVTGSVRRPMRYEMKQGETLSDLFRYCGGFGKNAYNKNVRVIRQNGNELEVCTVGRSDFGTFKTQDGDSITIESVLDRYTNKLEIRGAVYRPGLYQLGQISTVRQLVQAADGVMGDAYMQRAILQRENSDLTRSAIGIDLDGIMKGTAEDVALQKNDILYIPSIHDIHDMPTISIHGEVARPGDYVYAQGLTIGDLIIQAGGLLESAATSRVDVARRIKDPASEEESSVVSESFRFSIDDRFHVVGDDAFLLQAYDEIYVRRSPSYSEMQNVTIKGEVLFPGEYPLSRKNERLSDVITKAGGITNFGFAQGARLTRKMNQEELLRQESAREMAKISRDSISTELLSTKTNYSVGINLQQALKEPHSDVDIVLRDGDIIEIPALTNTVKINGAVMFPNTVSYLTKKNVRYYINQAGGFGNEAKKRKAYIVCMNGEVKRAKMRRRNVVEPGCEIIVPMKNTNNWSIQQTMSVATASASLATMVATIANLMK